MVEKTKSGTISPKGAQTEGELIQPTPFDRFLRKMSLTAETDTEESTGDSATQLTVERILEASEENLWNAGDLNNIGGKTLIGIEQRITDYAVRFSKNNVDPSGELIQSKFTWEERGMYLLVTSTIIGLPEENPLSFKIGQKIIWNTSAPDIVPKIWRFHELGRFPLECVIRGTDLGAGRTYLRLKPIPKRVVSGTAA